MTKRTFAEILAALKQAAQWRSEHKAHSKMTSSRMPNAWLFHAHQYARARWGIFYYHRFHGWCLSARWKDALAHFESIGSGWHSFDHYQMWAVGKELNRTWESLEAFRLWRGDHRLPYPFGDAISSESAIDNGLE